MVGKKGEIGIGTANDDKLGTIRKVLPNPPTPCVIKLEIYFVFSIYADDVARSRGPHPFGRSGKLIFGVLRVFRVKSTGPRARERMRTRRRMDFRSLFLRILG